jgi:hypothetical protein
LRHRPGVRHSGHDDDTKEEEPMTSKVLPVMTDRMNIYDRLLTERKFPGLRRFIEDRYAGGRGKSWDDITLDLRDALRGTDYEPPRESVIQMAMRFGIITERPKGQARVRRRQTSG